MIPFLSPWLRKRYVDDRNEYIDKFKRLTPTGGHTYSRECRGADASLDLYYVLGRIDDTDRISMLVREAEREIADARWRGLLKPFVEGEGIGVYVALPQPVPPAPSHAQLMEERQEALLHLRDRNNRIMKQVLKGLVIPLAWLRMFNPVRRTR